MTDPAATSNPSTKVGGEHHGHGVAEAAGTPGDPNAKVSGRINKTLLVALVKGARPQQWSKNLLVFAAPATAGLLTDPDVLVRSVIAFAAFSCVSSACYYTNDVIDVEKDRIHPEKRLRPVAAGRISLQLALCTSLVLLALGVGLALAGGMPMLVAILCVYAALTLAYSLALKRIPIIELAVVTFGFVLRALAGGVAAHVFLSDFFLLVMTFGALFLVAAKRHAELSSLGAEHAVHRQVLADYSGAFLSHIRIISSAVAISGYSIWAFRRGDAIEYPLFELSVIPFVLALLRYEWLVEQGHGGEPADILRHDRMIQMLSGAWVVLIVAGVWIDPSPGEPIDF